MSISSARPSQSRAPETVQEWRDAVLEQERSGELLAAFDLAERGIERHLGDVWLKHRAVLMLARAGATEEAARRFEDYRLGSGEDEDVAALRARIAKDRALAADPDSRRSLAIDAAALYAAIFARTGGYYPAVNAATLQLVAGDPRSSRATARTVLEVLARLAEDSYYAAASEGEARLLLGEGQAAAAALRRAAEQHGNDFGALATTRRQLRLICELSGIDQQLLAVLAGPAVVHFCGHRIVAERASGPFAAADEPAVRALIEGEVVRQRAGYAYGSLASGADILWAEALRRAGSELHVVLPFEREEFLAYSVAPAGSGWVRRFEACLGAATSVRYATEGAFLGDDVLFSYCSELAMGLALLRARYLDAEVRQLAVWDGEPARGAAGTSLDLATWRRSGHPVTVLDPAGASLRELGPRPPRELPHELAQRAPPSSDGPHRIVRAMLFGDIKGFSKLGDEQLPRFQSVVLGAFADVLARYREHVWHRNTWGDAIYAVLTDARRAAACAMDLQEALSALDLAAAGLPSELALRLGGHVGPVFMTQDPVLEVVAFIGSHVSRTARIEPVTPAAAVYVTEPFAAALALEAEQDFACDYVGHMPAAKDYGRLRMYRLRRAHSEDAPAGVRRERR